MGDLRLSWGLTRRTRLYLILLAQLEVSIWPPLENNGVFGRLGSFKFIKSAICCIHPNLIMIINE